MRIHLLDLGAPRAELPGSVSVPGGQIQELRIRSEGPYFK